LRAQVFRPQAQARFVKVLPPMSGD
jgi:hypothetical protein